MCNLVIPTQTMGKLFFSAIVFLISAVVLPSTVMAQEEGLSSGEMASPIDPHFNSPVFVGAIVGFGPSNQTGEFKTDKCDCPAFTEGTGINIVFGGLFEQALTRNVVIGTTLLYNYRSLTADYTQWEAVELQKEGASKSTVRIPFLHTTNSSFTYITAQPYLKYYFFKSIFAKVGPGLSFNVGSSLRHEKDMLVTTATLDDGETVNITLPADKDSRVVSATKAIIQDTEFPKMSGFLLSADIGLGAEIRAGKKMTISPMVQYSLPFMDVSSSGTGFKLPSFLFCLEVRYKFD